jgi:hypothetical protein
MAVTTSAWFATVTALLALFNGDSTLAANNVRVLDGPFLLDASSPNTLIVGGSSDPSLNEGPQGVPAGDFAQKWGEVGARARYEQTTVHCELIVRAGTTTLATTRATAQTLLAQIESLLRTSFQLSVGSLMWAEVLSGEIRQIQAQTGGSAVLVTFVIAARARLASQ